MIILSLNVVITSSQNGFYVGDKDSDPWMMAQRQTTTSISGPLSGDLSGSISPPSRAAVQPPTKTTSITKPIEIVRNVENIDVIQLENENNNKAMNNNNTIQILVDEIDGNINRRRLVDIIGSNNGVTLDNTLKIFWDPPINSTIPHALGLYVWCSDKNAKIYYNLDVLGNLLPVTFDSEYVDFSAPYIHIATPYQSSRFRKVQLIAVLSNSDGTYKRSALTKLSYNVEGSDRPNSFAFLVPGLNSDGYFLKIAIENKASARAQSAGSQEFADFYTDDGIGTYDTSVTATAQVSFLRLLDIDPDLTGFEGGIPYNTSSGQYYGVLVPYHNGKDFIGKVVRINLKNMDGNRQMNDFTSALAACKRSYRREYYDPPFPKTAAEMISNLKVYPSNAPSAATACITILDLSTYDRNARGFIRGFQRYPYIYLSPGQFTVPVRLNMETFSLSTTKFLQINSSVINAFGGYSGGFVDGTWACYCPYKTNVGFVGGIRSQRVVDKYRTSVFYHGVMTCINDTAWNQKYVSPSQVRTIDFSKINPSFRGYSDAIRVGRYAYFAPLATNPNIYSGKIIRMYLGTKNIAQVLDDLKTTGKLISSLVDILDVSIKAKELMGFIGLFNQGKYLMLVPYRNSYSPKIGQRGHGNVVRVDLNIFDIDGVEYYDVSKLQRAQIPSVKDEDLKGFSYGFASGKYSLFVPFYSGTFSGKVCRIITYSSADTARITSLDPNPLTGNVQELNLKQNEEKAYMEGKANTTYGKFRAFRGGFVSIWPGTDF